MHGELAGQRAKVRIAMRAVQKPLADPKATDADKAAVAAKLEPLTKQLAAEWGVPMLALVITFAAVGLWRMRRAVRAENCAQQAVVGAGLWAACVAVAVDSCLSGNFVMPMSQMWIALLIGWSAAWTRGRAPVSHESPRIAVPIAMMGALVTAALALQLWAPWAVRHQVSDMDGYLNTVRANVVRNDHDSPRFWSHGWF